MPQIFLRVLKRAIENGVTLTRTNFYALMEQQLEEQPGDDWPKVCETAIHVLIGELGIVVSE